MYKSEQLKEVTILKRARNVTYLDKL